MDLILAPLKGITTAAYRRIYHKHFPYFDTAISPFISPTVSQTLGRGLFSDLLAEKNENSIPLYPQVLLNTPDVLYPFLDKIADMGFKKININMGCPAPVVVKKNKGAGLLNHAETIDKILTKITADKRFEISVKVRLGMDDKKRIFDLLPIIASHEVDELIVHPRTAKMIYSGESDLQAFEQVVEKFSSMTSSRIIYNGDVFSRAKYKKIDKLFGNKIAGVMIGRGVLVNPLLPGLIKGDGDGSHPVVYENPTKKLYAFMDDLLREYKEISFGEKPVLGKMKELWTYLQISFEDSRKFAKKILKSQSLFAYEKHVDEIFENCRFDFEKEIMGNIED